MMDWLIAPSGAWPAVVWPVLWQGTVVGLAALALVPLARRLSPTFAMGLAAVALLKFFVPPAGWLAPFALLDRAAAELRPATPLAAQSLLGAGLLLVYLAGLGLAAAGVWRRRRELQRIVAASDDIHDAELHRQVRSTAARLGLRRVPAVRASDRVETPMATGVRHPTILLPRGLHQAIPRDQLQIVLAHELVHHRSRDLSIDALLTAATSVWWFHPVVWQLARQLRALREDRCDDRVIALGVEPMTYCRTLLAVAATVRRPLAVAMRESTHPLGRRFARLLDRRPTRRGSPALVAAGVGCFAAVALPSTPSPPVTDPAAAETIAIRHVDVRTIRPSPPSIPAR